MEEKTNKLLWVRAKTHEQIKLLSKADGREMMEYLERLVDNLMEKHTAK